MSELWVRGGFCLQSGDIGGCALGGLGKHWLPPWGLAGRLRSGTLPAGGGQAPWEQRGGWGPGVACDHPSPPWPSPAGPAHLPVSRLGELITLSSLVMGTQLVPRGTR